MSSLASFSLANNAYAIAQYLKMLYLRLAQAIFSHSLDSFYPSILPPAFLSVLTDGQMRESDLMSASQLFKVVLNIRGRTTTDLIQIVFEMIGFAESSCVPSYFILKQNFFDLLI